MGSLWSVVAKPKNRVILSWIGGGIVVVASGAWAVVTYVWPAHDTPTTACAQQGSVAAGRDASGNTINYTGGAPQAGGGVACADSTKK